MDHRISDLLDCLEDAGQDLKPRGGDAARVRAKTFAKLHGEESIVPLRRRARPLTALIAAAAALMLLCGSAFAAWKLGAFRFTDEFGPAGEALDAHAQSYEPETSASVPASFGYASWVKAQLGDYNLTLLRLDAVDGTLRATVDLSAAREGVPAFRDSGLRLCFADYETVSSAPRQIDAWKDRVELSAALPARLEPDAELAFSLSGPGSGDERAVFRLNTLTEAWQELAASERQHFAESAQTRDYRFSLRSLSANASDIYAVLDVEALTDYGLAHLDEVPEFSVYNRTRHNSGTLLDAQLVGSEEGLRRYLLGHRGDAPLNQLGDDVCFEILELFEEGDLSGHPYYLFDVKLKDLAPDGLMLTKAQGEPADRISWQSLRADAFGMTIEGLKGEGRYYDEGPVVILVFRDGTQTRITRNSGTEAGPGEEAIAAYTDLIGHRDGSVTANLRFSTPLELAELSAVIVDGQRFSVA